MALDDDFTAAQQKVNSAAGLDNTKMLELYGLYKQATAGDVRGSRPGTFDLRGRAKYDAWASRKGLTKDEAKQQYVAAAAKLK